MNRLILAAFSGSLLLASNASAAVIQADLDFRVASNVSGGENTGGLGDGTAATVANGSDILNFRVTIDDTADTGAIYSALFVVSGVLGNSDNSVIYLGPGIINMQSGTSGVRQNSITTAVSSITHVSGPNPGITFDGISSFKVSSWANDGSDSFTIDGNSYSAAGVEQALVALAPSGSTHTATGANYRLDNIRGQFTVVPEPSVALLGGLGLLGLLRRRRA